MSLGAGRVLLRIEADGAGAGTAVDRIVALVHDGFGELAGFDRPRPEEPGLDTLRQRPIGVSPGRVVGPALRMTDLITRA